MRREPSRRSVLAALAVAAVAPALPGCDTKKPIPPKVPGEGPFAGGEYYGDVPFTGESDRVLGQLDKEGLDGRLRVDLSALTPATLLTPAEAFYVRTREPTLPPPWPIEVAGLVDAPFPLNADEVVAAATDQGVHLMECSGNGRGEEFGLISAAAWDGVPLADVLAKAAARREGTRVLVRGKDHTARSEGGSSPGCSWIFSWEDLDSVRPFLATKLGGAPLTVAHGAPVRLFVPGWYGCCSPKWVDRIEVVADDVPSTPHMREFAVRTQQDGQPELARDFKPSRIELSATPIRVEEWRVNGERHFRVWGITWGGIRPTPTLEIAFGKGHYSPVTSYTPPADTNSWTLWWHDWVAPEPGEYAVHLRGDKSIPQPRMEGKYQRRTVVIA